MRVSLQRCLILWLCLMVSAPLLAAKSTIASRVYYDQGTSPVACNSATKSEARAVVEGFMAADSLCNQDGYYCWIEDAPNEGWSASDGCSIQAGYVTAYRDTGSCPAYIHEKNHITGEQPVGDCGCEDGWTDAGVGANPRCELNDQPPEECKEHGLAHDPVSGICQPECEHGMLNGACLPPPEDDNECTSETDDYRGEIVLGYGKPPVSFCGDIDQCSGSADGQIGIVNGKVRCLPKDYGVPECKGESISVVDDYGFVCEPLTNKPEEPDTPEAPNTDTDGDGEPDEYQRENDPESVEKGLDNVEKAINEGNAKTDQSNEHLGKIENAVKSIADNVSSLEQMGKNGELSGGGGSGGNGTGLVNDQGEDYLGDLADIKQNTKDTADTLTEIKDGPDDGYSTDGLGDAPTFAESSERLQLTITNNPTIHAVTTVPSIASNNTCPIWTIPATDYWQAMPIDSHCQILDDHRGLLSMLFIAVWTLAAVFVFLRA
ncbi:hypothetical protein [Marinobacter sp.]|uniref:hypothetical protein n=1 Tax=Marinobacter sp. TaxID=50741 RepID=UPI003A8F6154